MFNDALRAIIDLLKLRKDVKKTDLEIDKLEREQKHAKSLIQPASFDDIEKYDPKTRERIDLARQLEHRRAPAAPSKYFRTLAWFFCFILLLALLYVLYKVFA